ASRKLLPALFHLWQLNQLSDSLIVGVGRRCAVTDEYRAQLREDVDLAGKKPDDWAKFEKMIHFHKGEIGTRADFEALRDRVHGLEADLKLPGNRLFYYSVAPTYFGPITENLAAVGLLERIPADDKSRWHRIIVEKPFGHDLKSARVLDQSLLAALNENQIYRIDHYLGKETVQNVIAFRFANGLFEPVWNQKYVHSVQITVSEALGVEDRGSYYDTSGALRDMMQNHMLQLLALTAMEPPISLDADSIRDEKVKVLRAIRLATSPEDVARDTVRGQYGPGKANGAAVPGYREEKGVSATSTTPTYVAARIFLDNWRWANVPFLLRHGKRMAKRGTEIAIQFRTPPLALFRGTEICGHIANVLVIRIQPNEGIELTFGAKRLGAGMQLANVSMGFEYEDEFKRRIPDAYERLLFDALMGDATHFNRSDEIQAMWRWADTLLDGWDKLPPPNFPNYPAGGWGPFEAEKFFEESGTPDGVCPIGWRKW
ncbi:MAG: glucose-6-phosphate dehydrogenase, partial [Planctomycetia bacterium]